LLQLGCLARPQGVRPGPEQLAGLGVEEQQRSTFLDLDPDASTGQDLGGQHDLVASDGGSNVAVGGRPRRSA
jgi:hypothetical protein